MWWVDPEAAVACELAAVLNVSAGMALHQTHRGVALRDRLPRVAEAEPTVRRIRRSS